ncbi:MAG TPA: pentapeptide repeat-containing protein [Ensifer sp.]|nr:pentapeptide repeat-containing protein [Ensifer sp.]
MMGDSLTIALRKPDIKRDYFALFSSAILTIVSAVSKDPHNTLRNLRDAFLAFQGKETDTPENRAWVWAAQTITYAAGDMLSQAQKGSPLSIQKDDALKVFFEASFKFDNVEFDENALLSPATSPIFDEARKALPSLLLTATTGNEVGFDTIHERFTAALNNASHRSFLWKAQYLHPLETAFSRTSSEPLKREFAWIRHHQWISNQFLGTPIFSPDENETIPLCDVYLRLRCFWNVDKEREADERGKKEITRYAHIADLHQTMHDWLAQNGKTDTIRVITGGPGSGKSSFARAFSHEVIEKGKHRVAFVRLQQMRLTGDLRDDIGRYLRDSDEPLAAGGSTGLPENPLEWRKMDLTPLLLVFDGLDELTTNEEDHKKNAREFLLSLKRLIDSLSGTPVFAIVLGRNIACEEAMKVAYIPLQSMLNVSPIVPMTPEMCRVTGEKLRQERVELISDPSNLMGKDSRAGYWKNWAKIKGMPTDTIPEAVTHESMSELNHEPLLLHLLIISKYCGAAWELAAANKNLVYEDILEKIYQRNKAKDHFTALGLDKADFFSLMECLGLAAWRGNGRTGNADDFQRIRALHIDDEVRFEKLNAGDLKSVALNIHTRSSSSSEDEGFEFIHKSFGEYLAARALISHGKKLAKELERRRPDQVVGSWTELIGPGELTKEIIDFLYNEASLVSDFRRSPADKNNITKLLNWIIANGAPAHRMNDKLSWRDCEFRQRCVETATLALTSAMACALPVGEFEGADEPEWTVNVGWGRDRDSAWQFLQRMGVATQSPARLFTRRLNLGRCGLYSMTLHTADLSEAHLVATTLNVANLVKAKLVRANLNQANLAIANLFQANLFGATLRKANLFNADLSGASLEGANLEGANLDGANLKGANLEGANLEGANLEGASLKDAKGLTTKMLNATKGDSDTTLPDYIKSGAISWTKSKK